MGNRAVITTRKNWCHDGVGVYLHWNGGRDSVEGFLKYCELKGYRDPSVDAYGWARLCQVIGNFFGGTCSVGIDTLWHLDRDNGDNGVYLIDDWKIVDRLHFNGDEQDSYDLQDMLLSIDARQPEAEQIKDYIMAVEYPAGELVVGDQVMVINDGIASAYNVIGIGDGMVSGYDMWGVPFINRWSGESRNINNYLTDGVKWRLKK